MDYFFVCTEMVWLFFISVDMKIPAAGSVILNTVKNLSAYLRSFAALRMTVRAYIAMTGPYFHFFAGVPVNMKEYGNI